MNRAYYIGLAASELRMPIGADLVLREKPEAEQVLLDGERLGRVVAEAACRYDTPLAFPLMDLTVEKAALLGFLGVAESEIPAFHFHSCPEVAALASVAEGLRGPLTPRIRANVEAIRYVADNTRLLPVGMSIGPFSLMTKLIADPIAPVFMAGTGLAAGDDPEIRTVETCLSLAIQVIHWSVTAQVLAGAKAVIVCEPAANRVYLSPKQLAAGSDILERYVLAPNRAVRDRIQGLGADLIFHDCGELTDAMVEAFGRDLHPAVLSLGSSRRPWEDAARVPKEVVLYGNLPSKRFYSDELSEAEVTRMAAELLARMRGAGHPFILGSECDVLSVDGREKQIAAKVRAMLEAP